MRVPDKARTLELMRKYGIRTATVHFSGGHDEGHAELAQLTMVDAHPAPEMPTDHWRYREYTGWNEADLLKNDTPELAQLAAGLEQPIDNEYGSFAGEFYVDGDVIWDADAGTCVMEHDYETPSSEHLTTEF